MESICFPLAVSLWPLKTRYTLKMHITSSAGRPVQNNYLVKPVIAGLSSCNGLAAAVFSLCPLESF